MNREMKKLTKDEQDKLDSYMRSLTQSFRSLREELEKQREGEAYMNPYYLALSLEKKAVHLTKLLHEDQ